MPLLCRAMREEIARKSKTENRKTYKMAKSKSGNVRLCQKNGRKLKRTANYLTESPKSFPRNRIHMPPLNTLHSNYYFRELKISRST
jgi:hypothetical protein